DLSAQKITCATASFELFTGLQYLLSSLGLGYSSGQQKAEKRFVKENLATFGLSYTLYIYTQNDHTHLNYLPIEETIIGTTDAKLRYAISRDNQTNVHYKTLQQVLSTGNLLLHQGMDLFLQSDLGVLSIKKIEEITYDKEWVYDVSVPDCENFVAGVGAIVCHNSLDACEEARILPEISVELIQLEENRFRMVIEDNGPGIVKAQIPNIFAKLLYGSKFHKLSSTRGQQGIGISATLLYGQLTTGRPATIISKTGAGKKAVYMKLKIDTSANKPDIVEEKEMDWEKDHGTRVEIEMEGSYQKGRQSVDEYLKETAIVNPHATIIYTTPEAQQIIFPRATDQMTAETKEIMPHPYGVELGRLIRMLENTQAKTLQQFLTTEFVRVGPGTAKEICANSALLPNTKPEAMSREMSESMFKGIKKTKIVAPPTDCISPIGEEQLERGLRKEINAEFYCATTRPPEVYRGNPFIIECALAYGGEQSAEDSMRILRFANRVPLLYQQGACAITSVTQNLVWRPYGLNQSTGSLPVGPCTLVVHMTSVWVPFTSESKEALAHYPEIMKEIKLALQEVGRKLASFVNK
ncbi:MAG: DNA topoisomerase VI subunit B, partial [Nanoarchaeota archaeon]|nr:DNA topoisomerase VI subunit B [Nanoarchaeota archaeon]